MARATMLPLVADLVVCDPKLQADDMLQECPEAEVEVVGDDIGVVLDIRLHDLLVGPVLTRQVVCEPGEVLLEVVLLYICTAEGHEYRCSRLGQEAGIGLEATGIVLLIWTGTREKGPLTDDLWQEVGVRVQSLCQLLTGQALQV